MATDADCVAVILPSDLVKEIDRRVGVERRSEFVAGVVRQELDDIDARLRAFDEFVGSLADLDIPGWETPEAVAEWVREQRRTGSDQWEEAERTDPGLWGVSSTLAIGSTSCHWWTGTFRRMGLTGGEGRGCYPGCSAMFCSLAPGPPTPSTGAPGSPWASLPDPPPRAAAQSTAPRHGIR